MKLSVGEIIRLHLAAVAQLSSERPAKGTAVGTSGSQR